MLSGHRQELDALAQALEAHEVLDEIEVTALLGPSLRKRTETVNGQSGEHAALDPAPS